MGRVAKFLGLVAAWRWTPCVGLIASSVLFALLAIIVVPSKLKLPGPGATNDALELPDQPNVIGAPIGRSPERPSLPLPTQRRPLGPTPSPLSPSPPPLPPPEPVRPEPEHEDPPPPPPPAATPPPPPPPQEEEEEEDEPAPAPAQPPRFGAAPLRFLPQINRAVGNTRGTAPQPAPPAEDEDPAPAGR